MNKFITTVDETIVCSKCTKKYILRKIYYSSNVDDKRESYYNCPYCDAITKIWLRGNEDIETYKKEVK